MYMIVVYLLEDRFLLIVSLSFLLTNIKTMICISPFLTYLHWNSNIILHPSQGKWSTIDIVSKDFDLIVRPWLAWSQSLLSVVYLAALFYHYILVVTFCLIWCISEVCLWIQYDTSYTLVSVFLTDWPYDEFPALCMLQWRMYFQ